MKNNIFYLLAALLLFALAGCSNEAFPTPDVETDNSTRTLSVQLDPSAELKSIVKDLNSKRVFLDWEEGNFDINIVLKQGEVVELIAAVEVKGVKEESCTFEFSVPESIDLNQKFDVYGVVSENIKAVDGKALVGVGGRVMYELTRNSSNRDGYVPVYFEQKDVEMYGESIKATYQHLGSLAVITVLNKSDQPLNTAGFAVRPADGTTEFYHKAALPFVGNEELPYINLLDRTEAPINRLTRVTYPSVVIDKNDVQSVGFWFCPNTDSTPEVKLAMYDADTRKEVLSNNTRPARATAMQPGKAYHLYAEWDGTNLTLVNKEPEKPLPARQSSMKFGTSLNKGEKFYMIIGGPDAETERDIWIDLNNNGKREKGEYINEFSNETLDEDFREYTIEGQEFTIYGEVTTLVMDGLEPTAIDVTGNPNLDQFFVFDGEVETIDLTKNVNLRRVALEGLNAKNITFAPEATGMEEIYLDYNKLTSLDLTMTANTLLIDVSHNQLTEIKTNPFVTLWGLFINNNQLDATALNELFNNLNKAELQKYFEWQYTVDVWDNPGTPTANYTILTHKGWSAVKNNPNPNAGSSAADGIAPQALAARRLQTAPLK
ncbi:MAG: hypothetical protein Q4E10_04165 [Porphyromonas sp.]|nr:hypothetical protein [Porphyromonas sp.]